MESFKQGSDVASFVRKIILAALWRMGWRDKSGGWGPMRRPLQKEMKGA